MSAATDAFVRCWVADVRPLEPILEERIADFDEFLPQRVLWRSDPACPSVIQRRRHLSDGCRLALNFAVRHASHLAVK